MTADYAAGLDASHWMRRSDEYRNEAHALTVERDEALDRAERAEAILSAVHDEATSVLVYGSDWKMTLDHIREITASPGVPEDKENAK